MEEISKRMDTTRGVIGSILRSAGMGGNIVQPLSQKEVAEIISKDGFEYVSGFVNTKKNVTVRCPACGGTFERQFHIFKDSVQGTRGCKNECPLCRKRTIEQNRLSRKREAQDRRERDAQMKAQHKAEQLSREVSEQMTKRLANHVCKNCGMDFCMELTGYNSESYCSKRCQQRWHERVKNDKRMEKLKARPHDTDITLEKLFKRDGGVCYICGRMCEWEDIVAKDGAMIAGDSYPSIDHVKPVSKGGTHTWANIRLACRLCNTKKGWT